MNLFAMEGQQEVKSTIEIIPQELVDVKAAGTNLKEAMDNAMAADLSKEDLYKFFYILQNIGSNNCNAQSKVANIIKKIKAEAERRQAEARKRARILSRPTAIIIQ